MTFDEIDAYLVTLWEALRKRGVPNSRLVVEARGHLSDAVEAHIQRGMDPHTAQREALAQFGPADSVAATFVAETYGKFDRLVLLAAAMMGIAIAWVDSRPAWDATGVTALALIVAGATCGVAAPRRPWRWALAVGIWISVFPLARSESPDTVVTLVVTALSLAGAYAGAAIRLASLEMLPADDAHVFHDKAPRHDFVLVAKRGWISPELAAVIADPDVQLVPFLERVAPAGLGPLGKAHSITRLSDDTKRPHVKKFDVVFGTENKVLCRLEISGGGKKVSVHWTRVN